MFNFDNIVDRKGTWCTQWDFIQDRFGVGELIPFTISDMDFKTAPCIIDAMKDRLNHGVFGYSRWKHSDFLSAINYWYKSQYSINIENDHIVYGPSVI